MSLEVRRSHMVLRVLITMNPTLSFAVSHSTLEIMILAIVLVFDLNLDLEKAIDR
jgi:hypothetical protein